MQTYLHAVRGFSRNARLFLLTLGLATLIIDGVYAVVFNLYLLRLGYDPAFVGRINSAGLLTFALASLPAGELGKRYGSRRSMIIGLWIVFAGSITLPLAGVVAPDTQAAWLFASYVTMFLGYSLFFVNGVPFLMGATTVEQRNHAFAVQTAIFSLAAFMGGLLGGLLPGFFARADRQRYQRTDAVPRAALRRGPAPLARDLCRAPDHPEPPARAPTLARQYAAPRGRRRSGLPAVAAGRFGGAHSAGGGHGLGEYVLQRLHGSGTARPHRTNWRVVAAAARLLSVPAALAVATLATRWGQRNLVILAGLGTALALLPLALLPVFGAAAGGFIGVTIFAAIRYPTFLVYSMEMVTEEQRPTMSGLSEMTAGIAFSGMALIGGYVITNIGYTAHFLIGAVSVILGTALFAFYFRKPRGELARGRIRAGRGGLRMERGYGGSGESTRIHS